jgi:hypothetical protein
MDRIILLRRLFVLSVVVAGALVFKPWPSVTSLAGDTATNAARRMFARTEASSDDDAKLVRSLDGTSLELRVKCLDAATIEPDPSLSGKIEVTATADDQADLDQLEITEGAVVQVGSKGECPSGNSALTLLIKVPPATPIDLSETGSGDYRIGAVGGPLKLDLSGTGDVEAAQATNLDVRISGSNDVKIDRLDGTGWIYIAGSGDVTIDHAAMPSLAVELRGSGDLSIDKATIETLTASTVSSGDIRVGGTVKDATLTATGSGDITLTKATGQVQRHAAGSGEIHIGS